MEWYDSMEEKKGKQEKLFISSSCVCGDLINIFNEILSLSGVLVGCIEPRNGVDKLNDDGTYVTANDVIGFELV